MIDLIAREMRYGALAAAVFVSVIAPAGPAARGGRPAAFDGRCIAGGCVGGQGSGIIAGLVTTRAAPPAPLRVTIDQKVCGNELPDESVVADASGHLANVAVIVTGSKNTAAPPTPTVMNEKCRFVPRVQAARPRAQVRTSSKDQVLHTTNAQQEGGRTLFNVGLPVPGMNVTRPIAGAGIVRLFCNTHPWMRGWMIVTDEMSAVSGMDGRFTIPDVPAGTYELRFWHETLKAPPQKVVVKTGATTELAIDMQ